MDSVLSSIDTMITGSSQKHPLPSPAAHEFYIQPTDFDVGFLDYVEDENMTATCLLEQKLRIWEYDITTLA